MGCGKPARETPPAGESPSALESPPSETESQQTVQAWLTEASTPIKLLSFRNKNVTAVAGHRGLFFVEFDCEIEFLANCYWKEEEVYASLVPVQGMVARKKGDRAKISERVVLKKTDRGWILQG
jgi:hypothetical protein